MHSKINKTLIPGGFITTKIFVIRDKKVKQDKDLAELYDMETRRLNEQDEKILLISKYSNNWNSQNSRSWDKNPEKEWVIKESRTKA